MRKLLADARDRAQAMMGPIAELSLAIVAESWTLSQELQPYFQTSREMSQNPKLQIFYVFSEFICLFVHLANREARNAKFASEKCAIFRETLELMMVAPAIDMVVFPTVPAKRETERVFLQCLREADVKFWQDYPEFDSNMIDPKKCGLVYAIANDALVLTGRISGSEVSDESRTLGLFIIGRIQQILTVGGLKNLGEMVAKAGRAIESCDGPPLPGLFREQRDAEQSSARRQPCGQS